jgi:hypothetical protein
MIAEFQAWLEQNMNKFPVSLQSAGKRRGCQQFQFAGVKRLVLHIQADGQFNINVYHKSDCIDILAEFDIHSRKTASGRYFCSECHGKHRRYWSTQEKLLENHTFKPLLQWCKDNFRTDRKIVIQGNRGVTEAKIVGKRERVKKWPDRKYFIEEPLLVTPKSAGRAI